jgi:hypothetical protein
LLVPFTEDVEAGDLIISKQNAPTTLAHYTVVKKHPGYSSCYYNSSWYYNFSYQAEVNAGVDANKVYFSNTSLFNFYLDHRL